MGTVEKSRDGTAVGAIVEDPRATTFLVVVSAIFICLALVIASLNLMLGYRMLQNKRQGITKNISFIPILSILFSYIAYRIGRSVLGYWPMVPALLDPSTWMLASLPLFLLTKVKLKKCGKPDGRS
jgi:Trk-type K+ transport system membrane component